MIWDMFTLGPRDVKCFRDGLPPLARRLCSLPLQHDGSHGLGLRAQASAAFSRCFMMPTPHQDTYDYSYTAPTPPRSCGHLEEADRFPRHLLQPLSARH